MEHIVFFERNTVRAEFRRPDFPHEWIEYGESEPAQVIERIRNASIVISNKLSLREPELSGATHLKLIAIAATGSDCVDLDYCRARGIGVCNARGYAVTSVPEHVLTMIFALRRNLIAYRTDVEQGLWGQSRQFCLLTHELQDIRGSTLGVVGNGSIGKAMASLARAVGMQVLVSERKHARVTRAGRIPFEDTLRQSDVVTLHCPLTEETRNMIGHDEIKLMKRTALLINTARGPLIDDAALIEALRTQLIAGAGLDTLREEPPRQGCALLDLNLPNLIVTPHVAWASNQAVQTLADQVIDNIEAFVKGQPKNLLT
jgi:glycerate dehydrogenase